MQALKLRFPKYQQMSLAMDRAIGYGLQMKMVSSPDVNEVEFATETNLDETKLTLLYKTIESLGLPFEIITGHELVGVQVPNGKPHYIVTISRGKFEKPRLFGPYATRVQAEDDLQDINLDTPFHVSCWLVTAITPPDPTGT